MPTTALLNAANGTYGFSELLENFFTHKDFLPSADKLPGTMFTPLHFVFAGVLAIILAACIWLVRKLPEKRIKLIFTILWATLTTTELIKIIWECFGKEISFNLSGNLPFYPCSIWMFAMPFVIWGKGRIKNAACGYVCTLGLLGGLINFVYPATILGNYSCVSFPGFQTFFYHGALVFCALVMLLSGYHKISFAENALDPLLAAVPAYIMSLPANITNIILGTDYMFFRCNSFFLTVIGNVTPDIVSAIIVYIMYAVICSAPYYISYFLKKSKNAVI